MYWELLDRPGFNAFYGFTIEPVAQGLKWANSPGSRPFRFIETLCAETVLAGLLSTVESDGESRSLDGYFRSHQKEAIDA